MNNSTEEWRGKAVSVVDVVLQLWKRPLVVCGCVLAGCVALAMYAFLATPIYRASTVLVSAGQDRSQFGAGVGALAQFGGLASLAGVNIGGGDTETEEALAVIRSRQFIHAFIGDKKLMPILFGRKSAASGIDLLKWVRATPSISGAYRLFVSDILLISTNKKTGLLALTIDWRDPEQAALWANEIVERINSEMRGRAIEKANASIAHLQTELDSALDVGTREAINRLIESQIRQRMLASVNKEYAFRVVDKAVTPDLSDKVKPKRVLLVALGGVLGLMFGIGCVLVIDRKILQTL